MEEEQNISAGGESTAMELSAPAFRTLDHPSAQLVGHCDRVVPAAAVADHDLVGLSAHRGEVATQRRRFVERGHDDADLEWARSQKRGPLGLPGTSPDT